MAETANQAKHLQTSTWVATITVETAVSLSKHRHGKSDTCSRKDKVQRATTLKVSLFDNCTGQLHPCLSDINEPLPLHTWQYWHTPYWQATTHQPTNSSPTRMTGSGQQSHHGECSREWGPRKDLLQQASPTWREHKQTSYSRLCIGRALDIRP